MRRSKRRILCSLLLCCLFLFSGSLTVFADDETVLDGYHVDDVPYDTNFNSVLTASDDEYVLYSAEDDKTYKSAAVLSAAEVDDSEVVYSFKSVTNFIPSNIWRGSNTPTVTFPVNNGYTAIKYTWNSNDSTQSYYHHNSMQPFSKLQGGRKYRVTFSATFSRSSGSFSFYLANQKTPDSVLISLLDVAQTINMSNSGKAVSIDFTLPEGSSNVVPVIKGTLYQSGNTAYSATELTFYIKDFTIADITSEDLDSSLGKLGNRIKGFFDDLVESIKGFFIPDEGFFETTKEKFDALLSDHLGFLYQAPAMVRDLFQVISDWNPPEQPSITLPAFNFTIAGHAVHLWDEQVYTFDFLDSQPWSTLYAFYKTFVFVLLSVAMVNLAIKKYHDIVGGGSSDDN